MERKFKHIPTGKIIIIGGSNGESCQRIIDNRSKTSDLTLGEIIKGEDWQEVVEKDYEILKFRIHTNMGKPDGSIITNDNLQQFMLDRPEIYEIYSVKRLSDGEIFTIGDKIQLDNDNKEYGIITELYISHEQLRFYCGKLGGVLCHDIDKRNNFTKLKEPLFQTFDHVNIFEGDKYYSIEKHTFYNYGEIIAQKAILSIEMSYWKINKNICLFFSTKEKAEEYIINNKPCLSLNDIATIYKGINKKTNHPSSQANQLKNLVKQKLKQ